MNVIKLCGGLGNQLFQYAFGRVQKENGIDVKYSREWYSGVSCQTPVRKYILDKFCTEVKTGTFRNNKRIVRERGFDLGLLKKDGFNFSGYWQYPVYYEMILPILRKEFCVREEFYTRSFLDLKEEIIKKDNSVAIHVRRGDYLNLDDFPVMPLEYYQKAMDIVKGDYYIFSDDIEWCKANFEHGNIVHLNEYLDFELMKSCKHQILSRSSFGWWAAHLNSNFFKKVIVPTQQITSKVRPLSERDKVELFDPQEWIYVD